jgi:NAD-dependent deacetylase
MKTIVPGREDQFMQEAIDIFSSAKKAIALTGAGISVPSGIPDFRSPGGLWTLFSPDEYGTIEVFMHNPEKAWQLYRELGKGLQDKKPNQAHHVLAEFEEKEILRGVVTQNIDNLHQRAGSRDVYEIHGDHQHLQCIRCDYLVEAKEEHYTANTIPRCTDCDAPLKPNVVLFGEAVRRMDDIHELIAGCDLLMVIGTSAQVYPAAGLPAIVKQHGGKIFEFNMEDALTHGITDFFFRGDLSKTLPAFREAFFA